MELKFYGWQNNRRTPPSKMATIAVAEKVRMFYKKRLEFGEPEIRF